MKVLALLNILVVIQLSLTYAEVVKVGNSIIDGAATTKSQTAYLINRKPVTEPGYIFALSAFFKSLSPVYIQIWRPIPGTNTYRLVKQWVYTAIKAGRREDIYLQTFTSSNTCFRVETDDKLGLYFPENNGSVAYDFAPGGINQGPIALQQEMTTTPQVGDEVVFDPLSWPYEFSIAAYFDTDLSNYPSGGAELACIGGLQIPLEEDGYERPPAAVTGAPGPAGATGATGPAGPKGDAGQKGDRGQRGEIGATGSPGMEGPAGQDGANGAQGPIGPQGPEGAAGPQGIQGEKGDKGDEGPAGKAGNITIIRENSPDSQALIDEDCNWCPSMLSPYLILGLIIWVALVTLILVIVITVISCRKTKQQQQTRYQKNAFNNENLWKNYENGGFDNEKPPANGDTTYSAIEEGRTAF